MNSSQRKLAVILHADVIGSTVLVQQNETLAHERIVDVFKRFSKTIESYGGIAHEIRGDALLAEFERTSDAVSASLAFQMDNAERNEAFDDGIRPEVRVGIAIGEVIIADGTLTGPDVVMAQRVEQLAEPNGICIQGTALETIPRRLQFESTSLGKQQLKGFDDPVRVYAINTTPGTEIPDPEPRRGSRQSTKPTANKTTLLAALAATLVIAGGLLTWLQPWQSDVERADPAKMAYPLPDKPSIAVLPFANMSDDKEQEYFSDGITEDIITDISKVSGLFVLARNSTFTYKGQAVKIRRVAEELGVRYVLEGSVRRAGEKIRITAQLIDALTGNHVWADRYDRDLEDVFTVQSEVARQVAKALEVTLKANENERLFQKYTTSIEAYDVFLQAKRTVDAPIKENILSGEQLFKRVIELDPDFAGGYAGLSFNYSVQVRFDYSETPDYHLAQTFELANKAIEIDNSSAWGYIALGGAHLANDDPKRAVEAMQQALLLDPNGYETNLFMGFYLQFAGDAPRAVEHLQLALRLSPVKTVRDMAFMGLAQFMNRNYAESVRVLEEMYRKYPRAGTKSVPFFLAAAYALLERPEKAAAVVEKQLKENPDFNLSQWQFHKRYKSEEYQTRLYSAAKKAGFPEFSKQSFPDKPSIAVLPFNNMSNDVEQNYFADGLTEDLITDLSKVSGLFVIARNSVFTYKNKAVKIAQVASELGVRYVLEGSVRRGGDQVRINAQLIDATTGGHLWAERYDGSMADVFAMQDQVNQQIIAALSVELSGAEKAQWAQIGTNSLEAHDAYLKGWEHYLRQTPENHAIARDYFLQSLEYDSEYNRSLAALAALYWEVHIRSWAPALRESEFVIRDTVLDYLDRALVKPTALALVVESRVHVQHGKHEEAIATAKRALEISNSDANAQIALARALILSGRPSESYQAIDTALRLDPYGEALYLYFRGLADFGLENYASASTAFSRSFELNKNYALSTAALASAYGHLGQQEKAEIAWRAYVESDFTEFFAQNVLTALSFFPYKHDIDKERMANGWRVAGVPETEIYQYKLSGEN